MKGDRVNMTDSADGGRDLFSKDWMPTMDGWKIVFLPPYAENASFAVESYLTVSGRKLELMTKQERTDEYGRPQTEWHPAKTPMRDTPEKVITFVEGLQKAMGAEWTFNGDAEIFEHKDGLLYAKVADDTGRLELCMEGHGLGFVDAPEHVFREGEKRLRKIEGEYEPQKVGKISEDLSPLFSNQWENNAGQFEYSPPGIVRPSFAVDRIETPEGTKLQLLTEQITEHGDLFWLPAKTPLEDSPERVIQEVERRQQAIDKNWRFDGNTECLVHRGGYVAARPIDGDSTRLELLRVHLDLEKGLQLEPLKTPFIASREDVFAEGERRHTYLTDIREGRKFPSNYTESTDNEGRKIGIHESNQFAARNAGEGKLEILTPQMTERGKLWRTAEKAFKDWPFRVYSEINRRVHEAAQAVHRAIGKGSERKQARGKEL